MMAVEGITSKGRFDPRQNGAFRTLQKGALQKCSGEYDQKIFQSGIAYFK